MVFRRGLEIIMWKIKTPNERTEVRLGRKYYSG
jgi:hypothetical protein